MLKPDSMDGLAPVDDRDCILEYPSIETDYVMLFSVDQFGAKYEELRTPRSNMARARRYLLDGLRGIPSRLRRLK